MTMTAPTTATTMLVRLMPVTSAILRRSAATHPPTMAPTIPSTTISSRPSRVPMISLARKPAIAPTTSQARSVIWGMSIEVPSFLAVGSRRPADVGCTACVGLGGDGRPVPEDGKAPDDDRFDDRPANEGDDRSEEHTFELQ